MVTPCLHLLPPDSGNAQMVTAPSPQALRQHWLLDAAVQAQGLEVGGFGRLEGGRRRVVFVVEKLVVLPINLVNLTMRVRSHMHVY